MPTNTESLNRELFRLLSKYKPKPLDAEGKVTPVPEEADVFKFEFTKDGEEYGTVYVTLDDERVLTVYFGDDVSDSPGDKTPGLDYNDTWSGLLHQLSSWRMTKGLRGFKTQNKDRVSDDMARRNHMRNKDKIAEGYYATGKKSSYSDAVPSVKIVIEHSRVIEEGEQRYRNINRIFLENQAGERYLLDTKKPGIARVYARHIAEGGKVNDDRWSHIGNLCEEYQKMAGFVRATRNGQFNESAQSLVNEGIEHYVSLRESLSRMTGKRGYNSYFESWTPPLMEDGTEENNLNELFVQETLDPRIESVMPILNRIHKKVSESIVDKEMNKLAEWADQLVEGPAVDANAKSPTGSQSPALAHYADQLDHDASVQEDESIRAEKNPGGIPESETSTHKGGSVTSKNGVTQHKSGPGVYGGYDASRHPGSPEEKHVNTRGATTGHRTDKVVKHKDMEEAITPGASLQRFRNDPRGNQKLPATPKKELDEFDIDTLNQLASHPMAGTLAAAGGAAIGATIGKGITKANDWYQKRKEEKALDRAAGVKEDEVDENFINQAAQAVTSEGEHTQHAMRGRNPGANEFEHDFEPEDKIGNIHDKISKMLKRLEKPRHEPNMKYTDLGSTVLDEAAPWEDEDEEDKEDDKKPNDKKGSDGANHDGNSRAKHLAKQAIPKDDKEEVNESEERPYVCVHAKKGKCEVKASSSYQAAQKAAQKWGLKGTAGIDAHLADVKKDTSSLEESTDELARILTIMNHRR